MISDFCVVDLSLLTQKKVDASNGVRWKTHWPGAGGRRLLTSTVRHELCALYRQTAFELIELLTDITTAAAQHNKSLAGECKQAEEQIRTRKKWSIKWLRCYNKILCEAPKDRALDTRHLATANRQPNLWCQTEWRRNVLRGMNYAIKEANRNARSIGLPIFEAERCVCAGGARVWRATVVAERRTGAICSSSGLTSINQQSKA